MMLYPFCSNVPNIYETIFQSERDLLSSRSLLKGSLPFSQRFLGDALKRSISYHFSSPYY